MKNHRTASARLAGWLVGGVVAVAFSGCTVHARPTVPHHHHRAEVVVVAKGHVHTRECGHYRYHGRWYHVPRHGHGPRCGHTLVRGTWVLKL